MNARTDFNHKTTQEAYGTQKANSRDSRAKRRAKNAAYTTAIVSTMFSTSCKSDKDKTPELIKAEHYKATAEKYQDAVENLDNAKKKIKILTLELDLAKQDSVAAATKVVDAKKELDSDKP